MLEGLKILNQFEEDLLKGYDDFRTDHKYRVLLKKLIESSDKDFENNFIRKIKAALKKDSLMTEGRVKGLWARINGCVERDNVLMTLFSVGGVSLLALGVIAVLAQFMEVLNIFIIWIGLNVLAALVIVSHSMFLSFKQKVSLQNIVDTDDKRSVEEEIYLIQHYVIREAQRFEDKVIGLFMDSRRQKMALIQTNISLGVEAQIEELDKALEVIKQQAMDLRMRLIGDLIEYMDLVEKTAPAISFEAIEAFYSEDQSQKFDLRIPEESTEDASLVDPAEDIQIVAPENLLPKSI